jgi:hypothetical protein
MLQQGRVDGSKKRERFLEGISKQGKIWIDAERKLVELGHSMAFDSCLWLTKKERPYICQELHSRKACYKAGVMGIEETSTDKPCR